jgi:hypothetical protein
VVFNLNLLHGRIHDYSNPKKPAGRGLDGDKTLPPWDHSEAQALMEWTVKNVKQELWPAAFGLGNELNGYISPEIWAADMVTMYNLIRETFGKAAAAGGKVPHPQASHLKELFGSHEAAAALPDTSSSVPFTYGPCNAVGSGWSTTYMNNITALNKDGLGAFSFHTYNHQGARVADVANMVGGIDKSRASFTGAAAIHSAANTNSQLWITETAWSAGAPADSPAGGAKASIDGMCRASDIAWNLDALGAAAEVGVDVFCRETLAGDWLEVIGLWQPGAARSREDNAAYTPHPDFWIAALWKKLMDVRVIGANTANTTATVPASAAAEGSSGDMDAWVLAKGMSCNFGEPANGTDTVPLLGKVRSYAECQAKCVDYAKPCKAWSWCGDCGGEWTDTCYGRLDNKWVLSAVPAAISGCDKSKGACVPPPPPPPPPPPQFEVRTFAHCSKLVHGAVMYAVAVSPCVRTETVDLTFPTATKLTTWWLSALDVGDDMISLNGEQLSRSINTCCLRSLSGCGCCVFFAGRNLTVSVDAPLPTLEGMAVAGDSTTMPTTGVCTVGFVQAEYSSPVAACQ